MRKSRTTSMRLNLKLLLGGLFLFVVVCCSSLVHANSLTATSPQEQTITVPLTSWNELKGNLIQADALIKSSNYQRAVERLEQTQNELNRSRRLNQELKLVIERSSELNSQASNRIERIEDYQRRTEQGIGRAQSYQRETGRRVSESIGANNQASELIGRSLRIIERVESGNKE